MNRCHSECYDHTASGAPTETVRAIYGCSRCFEELGISVSKHVSLSNEVTKNGEAFKLTDVRDETHRAKCDVPKYGHLCASHFELVPPEETAHYVKVVLARL